MTAGQMGQIYAAEAEMEPYDPIAMADRLQEASGGTMSRDDALKAALEIQKNHMNILISRNQLLTNQQKQQPMSSLLFGR